MCNANINLFNRYISDKIYQYETIYWNSLQRIVKQDPGLIYRTFQTTLPKATMSIFIKFYLTLLKPYPLSPFISTPMVYWWRGIFDIFHYINEFVRAPIASFSNVRKRILWEFYELKIEYLRRLSVYEVDILM